MRIRTSYAIAGFLTLALVGWLWSGQIGQHEPADTVAADSAVNVESSSNRQLPMAVQVEDLKAERIELEIIANGKTAPNRLVQLRGETNGRVIAVHGNEGSSVKEGELLVELDLRDRDAAVLEAYSVLRQRRIEAEAAKKLSQKGFQAEINVAQAEANYAVAEASLKRAQLEHDHTSIKAPFDGILDLRDVEIGDYVDVGDPIATVIDVDPFLIKAEVIETEVGKLRPGMEGTARLATGETVRGKLRYVGSQADEQTRTFSIEMEVPNLDGRQAVGVSAKLQIKAASVFAHQVSPSVLTLSDQGDLGVKTVDESDKVVFMPVAIARTDERSVWLTGLPDEIRLITVGQDFVRDGSQVRPTPAKTVEPQAIVSEVAR